MGLLDKAQQKKQILKDVKDEIKKINNKETEQKIAEIKQHKF